MNFLTNAFSLQMIKTFPAVPIIEEVDLTSIPADAVSAIGHADTANVLSKLLNRNVECNRVSVTLTGNDTLFVFQVVGGRLPEGATTLPENFSFKVLKIHLATSVCHNNGVVCPSITPCPCNCTLIR